MTAQRGDFVPGQSCVVSLLLRAQNATTPAEAHELIGRLADPFLRALARREWDHLNATQTTVIGDEK